MKRLLALCAALLPAAAPAADLHCLGTRPGFMFMVEAGDLVSFDYLGDGRFGLEPALETRVESFARFELVTLRQRWDVFLEARSCEVLQIELPVTIEIAVPTSAGIRPMTGCCRWAD